MSLILTRNNEDDFEVNQLRFSRAQNLFIAKNNLTEEILEFKYPLDRDDKFNTKETDFEIYLFHKDNFAANEIYQLKINTKRLGWIIPIQALLTSEHDYATNEHFFPYSYNAYRILLKNKINLPYNKNITKNEVTLESIYGENTIIFIAYRKYIKEIKTNFNIDFKIEDYLLFFYQYGYTFLSPSNFSSLYDLKLPNFIAKPFPGKQVELERISEDLKDDKPYLNSLIQGLIKLEKHPLVKFHLLYSVIELFISKIFDSEFKSSLQSFLNTTDFYDSKEKLNKLANEKDRIKKLFSNKCPNLNHVLLQELQDASNSFLSFVFAPQIFKKKTGEAIYKVRSTIFHNLRVIPNGYETQLSNVLAKLEAIILDISLKLKL